MKMYLIIIFVLANQITFSQVLQDSVTVPVITIIETAQKLQELEHKDTIQSKQIISLTAQVNSLEALNSNNESIMRLKNIEVDMYKGFVSKYVNIGLPPIEQEKWYQTRTFSLITGGLAATAMLYTGAKLAAQL